jgi:hypothetical protein
MTTAQLIRLRLYHQQITHTTFKEPQELVAWFGAMQAQDFAAAKWAVATRLKGKNDHDIQDAIANKQIVRTWSLRGTWQFMSANDVRWILKLIGPRLGKIYASHFRSLSLDKTALAKSQKVIARILGGGKTLTRNEIKPGLEKQGISTEGLRLNFIFLRAALDGLICSGPRRGKEFTFVLMDEWIGKIPEVDSEEALHRLTIKYFQSHSPATIHDFAWWSGLTIAEVKKGIEMVRPSVQQVEIGKQTYWMVKNVDDSLPKTSGVYLLPAFDEYLVGYKDRSAVLDPEYNNEIYGAGNGIFNPVIIINGKVAGTWKRIVKPKSVRVEMKPFLPLSATQERAVKTRVKQFGKFLELPLID